VLKGGVGLPTNQPSVYDVCIDTAMLTCLIGLVELCVVFYVSIYKSLPFSKQLKRNVFYVVVKCISMMFKMLAALEATSTVTFKAEENVHMFALFVHFVGVLYLMDRKRYSERLKEHLPCSVEDNF